MPAITFCPNSFGEWVEATLSKFNCTFGDKLTNPWLGYQEYLVDYCLTKFANDNSSLEIVDALTNSLYMNFSASLDFDVEQGVVTSYNQENDEAVEAIKSKYWRKILNYNYGFCFTFDLKDTRIALGTDMQASLYVNFDMARLFMNGPRVKLKAMFHGQDDWFDAGVIYPSFGLESGNVYDLTLRKTIVKALDTEKSPCVQMPRRTCLHRALEVNH